jgi:hypothetical protein
MSDSPQFRSQAQVIGGMVETFLSRLDQSGIAPGLASLKPGSPYLAIFEAVGQVEVQTQQQMLAVLDTDDVDRARGDALDRIGRKEKLPRRGETYARGKVTISDSGITKVATKVYQGAPAPIPGVRTIYAADASAFPESGALYIGRGTTNLEGPLAYSSVVQQGSYYVITLVAATQRHHNISEAITLAQGGDRIIAAGQVVTTPQGNASDAVKFQTSKAVTLLDGETFVEDVPVVAQRPGTKGNVPAGAIKEVQAPAFTGMAVTNPLPISNALNVEDDEHYRARLKAARQTRQKGTRLAIESSAVGIQAQDESATITSAFLARRQSLPSLLVIDDGSGYEEKDAGTAYEVLVDSAAGGENTFYLTHGRPVAKASVVTELEAPFALRSGDTLAVKVGGRYFEHAFAEEEFRNIAGATAYEVVASINRNPSLPFAARTVQGGKKVAVFAREEANDDIEVVASLAASEANEVLGFPGGRADTLRLYRNDRLLHKDGQKAIVTTAPQAIWRAMSDGETLVVDVDGTGPATFYITDADFAKHSDYTAVSENNNPSAWAEVLNRKVPGLSVSVAGSSLELVSNRGTSSSASVKVAPESTLVAKGMFVSGALEATGRDRDYTLDRNRGQVELITRLDPGDSLTAGSAYARAYLEADASESVDLSGAADLWVTADASAQVIPHGLTAANRLLMSGSGLYRRFSAWSGTPGVDYPLAAFADLRVGDWAVISKDIWGHAATGAWRVCRVAQDGTYFDVEVPNGGIFADEEGTDEAYRTLTLVRTSVIPQRVSISVGTYALAALAENIDSKLVGVRAAVVNDKLRLTTETFGKTGSVALVAQNEAAKVIGFSIETASNDDVNTAAVRSGNSQVGTPKFDLLAGISTGSASAKTITPASFGEWAEGLATGLYWLRALPNKTYPTRFGSNAHASPSVVGISGSTATLDSLVVEPQGTALPKLPDRIVPVRRFALGPESRLNLVLDGDPVAKSHSVPMFRRVKADPAVAYGRTIRLLDQDNANEKLDKAFGTEFDFSNFVLHGHARAVTNRSDSTRSALWRMKHFRGQRAAAQVAYKAPLLPERPVAVSYSEPSFDVNIDLPSGLRRDVYVQPGANLFRYDNNGTQYLCSAFVITNIARAANGTVTVTVALPEGVVPNTGFQVGDSAYVDVTHFSFIPGPKILTAVGTNTLTYSEEGDVVSVANPSNARVSKGAAPTDFYDVRVGDFASVENVSFVSSRTAFRVTAASKWFIRMRTAGLGAQQGWLSIGGEDDLQVFPLDISPFGSGAVAPTVAQVVAAVNALADAEVTGTVLGSGAGSLALTADDDANYKATFADGSLHIGSSAWNAAALTYDLTLKTDPTASLTALPNDWANEEFRLVPTTAKNIAAYLSTPGVTGFDPAAVGIEVSAQDGYVQVGSRTLGSGGSVRVTGGTANELRFEVEGAARTVGTTVKVLVKAADDLSGIANRAAVRVRNSVALPKATGWDGATTIKVEGGKLVVGGDTAWKYSTGFTEPTFGSRWTVEKVGGFVHYGFANGDDVPQLPAVPGAGDWVAIESGVGQSDRTGVSASARRGAAIVTLSDGKVLAIGGQNYSDLEAGPTITGATEIYDPATGSWSTTASCNARAFAAAVVLPNGKVLVTGGMTSATATTNTCQVFDPVAQSWAATGAMGTARAFHTATLMANGEVVVIGGLNNSTTATNSVEIFNGTTWRAGPWMLEPRAKHTATLFGDDRILVAGGSNSLALYGYAVYSHAAGVWSDEGAMQQARQGHSAVLLDSGHILLTGGSKSVAFKTSSWTDSDFLTDAEVFNTSTFESVRVASLKLPRAHAAVAKLQDGRVLVIGGRTKVGKVTKSAEVFEPETSTWSWAGGTWTEHEQSAAAVLADGKVLLFCGQPSNTSSTTDCEVFDPSYSPSAMNCGVYRVVAASNRGFWVENTAAVGEEASFGLVAFHAYDSMVPGDVLQVATNTLSIEGSWKVESLDYASGGSAVKLTGTPDLAQTALGDASSFVSVVTGEPVVQYHEVETIVPEAGEAGWVGFFLNGNPHAELISASAGSVIEVLDRLAFPTGIARGQDGYRQNTGLIAEANRVLYGDDTDPQSYPGVIAAGATINVGAPLIRRVQVRVAVRERSGANTSKAVQAAIAKVINGHEASPVAISKYLAEASRVPGVLSVIPLDPVPTTASDSIPVQPGEKAVILDAEVDIQVSVVGT